ncbi:transcriptional regulator, LysR family protein [Marinomonas sp. MED121]|uniref:LysR substrate-binding domain-containing protein n=1 Tax=Marinomonas sp. MED121 TaxID=314277 RepID=UPI0000690BB9|nr:LysR substrate-binding domain-containing protein [Marinomonas sp. MED121]EAQ66136.1 transcriptional regulator, LysR family protein [Marinomonas sp. MED121]
MKLTLDALEVLDAIDKKGSFAAAANALFRVPSTLTYTVQKLEEDLGFVIFRKEGRRSVLTPAGRVLLEEGRHLLLATQAMIDKAHQVDSGWEVSLNIALDTVWDIEQLLPILAEFQQLNTGVEINLLEEVMGGSLEALIEDRADIVLGGPPPSATIQGLQFKEMMQSQWCLVTAKDHPLTKTSLPLTNEMMTAYTSIVIKDSSRQSPIQSHRIMAKQKQIKVASMAQKISLIEAGIGIGFLPRHKIQGKLDEGTLVTLETAEPTQSTPQYCSWKRNNKGKAARWFIDRILSDKV